MEPKDKAMIATREAMGSRGIRTLYGRWLIDGAPRVLLFDTKSAYGYLDEWKGDLWSTCGIPSPPGDDETNEAIIFGYVIAWQVSCSFVASPVADQYLQVSWRGEQDLELLLTKLTVEVHIP